LVGQHLIDELSESGAKVVRTDVIGSIRNIDVEFMYCDVRKEIPLEIGY